MRNVKGGGMVTAWPSSAEAALIFAHKQWVAKDIFAQIQMQIHIQLQIQIEIQIEIQIQIQIQMQIQIQEAAFVLHFIAMWFQKRLPTAVKSVT